MKQCHSVGVMFLGGLLWAQTVTAAPPVIDGCQIFPSDNVWNVSIQNLPVDARSAAYISNIGPDTGLHADFGPGTYKGAPIGIPYVKVTDAQPLVPISFYYRSESDPGPYPFPPDAPIEGGSRSKGDRHVLAINTQSCELYEAWKSYPKNDGSWTAGSGAYWNLTSNALRPLGWTSADAAGFALLPGLVRYDEVAAGAIRHAIRFTVSTTQDKYIWPATHKAGSSTDLNVVPMGQRFRLKASFNTSGFSAQTRIILDAMKVYGIIVADNGSNWFLSGVPDDRWDNNQLQELGQVHGSDFEAVDESGLMVSASSGQVKAGAATRAGE